MLKLLLAALTAALAAVVLAGALPGAARGQSLGPSALPEGPGKEQVESVCTACHPASQITRSSGYTPAVWSELTATMIDLSGTPELREEITTDSFPSTFTFACTGGVSAITWPRRMTDRTSTRLNSSH